MTRAGSSGTSGPTVRKPVSLRAPCDLRAGACPTRMSGRDAPLPRAGLSVLAHARNTAANGQAGQTRYSCVAAIRSRRHEVKSGHRQALVRVKLCHPGPAAESGRHDPPSRRVVGVTRNRRSDQFDLRERHVRLRAGEPSRVRRRVARGTEFGLDTVSTEVVLSVALR
jgi:hypothetical protein